VSGGPTDVVASRAEYFVAEVTQLAERLFVEIYSGDYMDAQEDATSAFAAAFTFHECGLHLRDSLLARAAVVIAEQQENEL
jgi:hypothetical protein